MSDLYPSPEGHLSPDDVSAYLGTRMLERDRRQIEAHLADCDQCRAEVVEVRAMLRTGPRAGRRRAPILGLLGAAAAAAIVISVQSRVSSEGRLKSPADTERTFTSDAGRDSVHVVEPRANAIVSPTGVTVMWRRGVDDTQFTVTLMNERGDVQWAGNTRDSSVTIPDSIALTPGTSYIIYVDARRSDGTSAESGPRPFRVGR